MTCVKKAKAECEFCHECDGTDYSCPSYSDHAAQPEIERGGKIKLCPFESIGRARRRSKVGTVKKCNGNCSPCDGNCF